MSYKVIDFESYEAPNSVILGMVNEEFICLSGTPGGDDTIIDDDDY